MKEFKIVKGQEIGSDVKDLLNEERNKQYEETIHSLKEVIKLREDNIKHTISSLEATKKQIQRDKETLKAFNESIKNNSEYCEKKLKELKEIIKHNATESVVLYEDKLVINTNTLYIYEETYDKKYLLGEMSITIPNNVANDIKFKNLTSVRDGYSAEMHHPHIFGDGDACFGTFENQVYKARTDNNMFSLYLILLNFLRTVDIEDEAGAFITAWDEVDEDGKIITKGESNQKIRICEHCGKTIESDCYYCNDCDAQICEECMRVAKGEYTICANCAENYYLYCEECGDLIPEVESECTEIGNVCRNCYEEEFSCCENCGTVMYTDKLNYKTIGNKTLWICDDCYKVMMSEENEEF